MPYAFKPEIDQVMAEMPYGYLRSDMHANILYSNGYLEKTYGISYQQLAGDTWQALIHPDDKKHLLMLLANEVFDDTIMRVVIRVIFRHDLQVPFLFLVESLIDASGKRIGFFAIMIEVSQALHELCKQGQAPTPDPLTQLMPRPEFLHAIDVALQAKKNKKTRSALIIIDLREVKKINELWGYVLGDQLIVFVADQLQLHLGEKYALGHLESDKFGVFVEQVKSDKELNELVLEIQRICSKSLVLSEGKFTLDVSIGVVITSTEETNIDSLLRHAYEALGTAKRKDICIEYYDEKNHRVYRRTSQIVNSLFNAISQDQFELHYQPQVDAKTEKLAGIEVLLRWTHPEMGIIQPDEFIPVAEESGFIIHVGKWVIDHSLKQYKRWLDKYPEVLSGIRLSINLSPLQLLDENLIEDVSALLEEYQMKPTNLIFELTETAVMTHPEKSIEVLNRLKDLGIQLSMDDFGTGYSSLNYLRYLPIDQIKIDRSFIKAFEHSRQDAAVVKATISLAEAMGMDVIAEGVETTAELKFLRDNGCKFIQGYYFSHPMNAQGMEEYIQTHS